MKTKNITLMASLMLAFAVMLGAGSVLAEDGTTASGAWDSVMAVGSIALLAVAGILYAVTYIFTDLKPPMKKGLTFGAVIFLVLGVFAAFNVTLTADDAPVVVSEAHAWDATMVDNRAFITWPDQYTATWLTEFNSTSGAFANTTGSATFTLSVGRSDELSSWAYETAAVEDIGTFLGNSIEYDIIDKGADLLYEADWTDSAGNTFNMQVTLPVTEARADNANLTVTLNPDAAAQMVANQGSSFEITFGTYTWVINMYLNNLYA